jgi:1,4-alpha-glucan branching enzyme
VKWNIFPKSKANHPDESPAMKHNRNHDNSRSADTQLVSVRFEFTHPTATTVCIAGTFNQWQPEAKTLHPAGGGRWWKETALAPGTYEYCLVVDGQWMPDPLAKETVPNPFGGRNSILKVASSPEAAHRDDATNLPLKNANKQKNKKYEQTNTSNQQ